MFRALIATGLALAFTQVIAGGHSSQVDTLFGDFGQATPGCSIAVDQVGDFVHLASYGMGDLEQNVALTPDSVFYAASVSKQVVAMAAMLLQHQGKIELDTPVSAYLPQLPEYADRITVRHLLLHTSGIRDYFSLFMLAGGANNRVITEQGIMQLLAMQRGLNFTPGERWAYSNSAYFLISQIVEAVDGRNLNDFAQEYIFSPLGMSNSRFQHNHRNLIPRKAHGYEPVEDGAWLLADSMLDVVGSGGMYTTVKDLISWDRNFYDNRLGGGQALIEEMQTTGVLNSGEQTEYGLALSLKPYKGLVRRSHGGALAGYRAMLMRFPEHKFSVALLCNSSEVGPGGLAEAIVDIYLADHLVAETAAVAEKQDDAIGQVIELSPGPYAGNYYSEEVDNTIVLTVVDGKLSLPEALEKDLFVTPVAEDLFENPKYRFKLEFSRHDAGAISGFTYNGPRASGMFFRRLE